MLADAAVIEFHAVSAGQLRMERLPGRCALLRMADDDGLLPDVLDQDNVAVQSDLIFADAESDYGGVAAPGRQHARKILRLLEIAESEGIEHFVAQCQAGVGRSVAVCAALSYLRGGDFRLAPTYNRKLFRDILAESGVGPPAEPLVSLTVRVKYQPERLLAFLLSLQSQRYDNWECLAYTDGPNEDAHRVVVSLCDERVTLWETPERKGRWGHPYRQMAFEQCRGEWIGTQNDDNYLTPGFIEQLVVQAQMNDADLSVCGCLHRYAAWDVVDPGGDLCCWIAKADLVRRHRWDGDGFTADREYLESLAMTAGQRVCVVERPLVVKN